MSIKHSKKIICVLLTIAVCISFAACRQNTKKEESTSSDTTQTTSEVQSTTEKVSDTTTKAAESTTTTKETTSKKKSSTTKKKTSDYDTSISLNEALNVLSDFYGSTYNVNATIVEDGWQYFAVIDKKGEKYATVKVNLSTSDAVETIVATGETNEYNLLA